MEKTHTPQLPTKIEAIDCPENMGDVLIRSTAGDSDEYNCATAYEWDFADALVSRYNAHSALVDKARELANVAQDTTKDIIGFAGAERLDRAIDDIRALLSQLEANQ